MVTHLHRAVFLTIRRPEPFSKAHLYEIRDGKKLLPWRTPPFYGESGVFLLVPFRWSCQRSTRPWEQWVVPLVLFGSPSPLFPPNPPPGSSPDAFFLPSQGWPLSCSNHRSIPSSPTPTVLLTSLLTYLAVVEWDGSPLEPRFCTGAPGPLP